MDFKTAAHFFMFIQLSHDKEGISFSAKNLSFKYAEYSNVLNAI